jgi:acetyl-CoA C-acetyltransferase
MPEAVIVAAARSPIGRAFKGSMTELRPDDLTATIVQAAMARCPSSTRRTSTTCTSAAGCPAASRASTWPGS